MDDRTTQDPITDPPGDEFWQSLRRRLVFLGRQRGFTQADAEDLAQETIATAYAQIQEGLIREPTKTVSYVSGIFRHKAADQVRAQIVRRKYIEDMQQPAVSGFAVGVDPDVVLQTRRLLERLPPRERFTLVANLLGNMPTREIAGILRVRPKTAEGYLTRAKRKFAEWSKESAQEIRAPKRLSSQESHED